MHIHPLEFQAGLFFFSFWYRQLPYISINLIMQQLLKIMLYFWGVGLQSPTRVNYLSRCEKVEIDSLDLELDRGKVCMY